MDIKALKIAALVLSFNRQAPNGFPRGVLLNVQHGIKTYTFDTLKVLEWVRGQEEEEEAKQ